MLKMSKFIWFKRIASGLASKIKLSKDLGDGKSWAPLFFENIETNASIAIDIWMENLGLKCNLKTKIHFLRMH